MGSVLDQTVEQSGMGSYETQQDVGLYSDVSNIDHDDQSASDACFIESITLNWLDKRQSLQGTYTLKYTTNSYHSTVRIRLIVLLFACTYAAMTNTRTHNRKSRLTDRVLREL